MTAPTTTAPIFESVLVANRGEIAVRIIRTLRRLGIRSIAVYSDADVDALHVRLADTAVRVGPAAATESYLDIEAVLGAARRTGARAVHPGYGFLSENVEFARACAEAGVVFVGPSVDAIEAMADKILAKETVAARGVPVVPGSSGAGLDDAALTRAAEQIGFPLLIKPSAGGGGKGMQIVRVAGELATGLASARRIAAASFGDDALLLERLVERPRHIEVQIVADRAGAVVHLGERECSLQRRHQKVVEEAPSALLDAATRERIGVAACEVAKSVRYEGAGTVEFLVPAGEPETFYFIEMNTRLQVEHPVTEMVTGVDLVELQLRVAAGEELGFGQEDVRLDGHAIEARVYAESPARGFLPATGTVLDVHEAAGEGLRVDSSLFPGLVVAGHYDPMLAKVVAHGADRAEALQRLQGLLASTTVLGVDTNLEYLGSLLGTAEVRAGDLDTGLIERLGVPEHPAPAVVDLVAAALLRQAEQQRTVDGSPWGGRDGWRALGERRAWRHRVVHDEATRTVLVRGDAESALVTIDGAGDGDPEHVDGTEYTASLAPRGPGEYALTLDGVSTTLRLALGPADGDTGGRVVWVHREGRTRELSLPSRAAQVADALATLERPSGPLSPELRSPMPGTVVAVPVVDGAEVEAGAVIAVVEAMKMEHALTAPLAGIVQLALRVGDAVRRDQLVATVAAATFEKEERR